MLESDL